MKLEVVNRQYLQELKGALGEEILAALRDSYIADSTQCLLKISAFMEAGDLHGLSREAHSLKEASANLGFQVASLSAEHLQHACEKGDKRCLAELISQVTYDVETAISRLRQLS